MFTYLGEEATHIGSAAGLDAQDLIYGQYREAGNFIKSKYRPDGQVSFKFGVFDYSMDEKLKQN